SESGDVTAADANTFSPSRADISLVSSAPRTLLPAWSGRGENVPRPPLPGDTVTMPPLTPLLPGSPISYIHSPERSYRPAVAMTARTRGQCSAPTTPSFLNGLTPPSETLAPLP